VRRLECCVNVAPAIGAKKLNWSPGRSVERASWPASSRPDASAYKIRQDALGEGMTAGESSSKTLTPKSADETLKASTEIRYLAWHLRETNPRPGQAWGRVRRVARCESFAVSVHAAREIRSDPQRLLDDTSHLPNRKLTPCHHRKLTRCRHLPRINARRSNK
jgi:hypothetical protein